MYIPPAFTVTDKKTLHEFMREHSFATVISAGTEHPEASHLPLLLESHAGPLGTLVGHMARANTHWKDAAGKRVLVTFHGPHSYISPTWYAEPNVVPTWNYVTVHATGILNVIDDPHSVDGIVTDSVVEFESSMPIPWSLENVDGDFSQKLVNAVVGFRIEIQTLEGKWKLSQNHSAERRRRVVAGLRDRACNDDHIVAELVERTLTDNAEPA